MDGAGFKAGAIKLDYEKGVYYAGQVITGKVVFELRQPLTFSVLNIQFLGEATVNWSEEETEEYNGVKRYKEISYLGRDEYFNFTQSLAGGGGIASLPPGNHEFSFQFQIPPHAPSSFKGSRGQVTYSAAAYMVYPDNIKREEELYKAFEVVAPLDLNIASHILKQPIVLEFEDVYGCECFCGAAPVTVRATLPASGFCPGQRVPVQLHICNESSVEINKIVLQLITREKYRSQHPLAEYIPPEEILASVKKGSVMSKTTRNFTCDITVPDMIPPYLENCSVIDVGYFFKIIVKLSGCNDDFEDESEISLGLVPLAETVEGEYVHPMAHSLPEGPIPTLAVSDLSPGYVEPSNSPYTSEVKNAYPTNSSYPGNNRAEVPASNATHFKGYEIGFVAPQPPNPTGNLMPGTNNPPYPLVNSMPGVVNPPYPPANSFPAPPYPVGNPMPASYEMHQVGGYNGMGQQNGEKDLRIFLPPVNQGNQPSAPPPSS